MLDSKTRKWVACCTDKFLNDGFHLFDNVSNQLSVYVVNKLQWVAEGAYL